MYRVQCDSGFHISIVRDSVPPPLMLRSMLWLGEDCNSCVDLHGVPCADICCTHFECAFSF